MCIMSSSDIVHFPHIFESLLRERNITEDDLSDFLNPDFDKLHDPALLPDIDKARDRILSAIKAGEHITIFADYDADGIPGAVVFSDFFRRIGYKNVSFYIPHRHDEGFGMNKGAVEEILGRGAGLLVTVDCGISDVDEIALAQEKGLDVIITDHHEPKEILPKAFQNL